MKKTLRQQIYENMNLKETDELLLIWHEHDTYAWREETFEIIKSILLKRLGEIPPIPSKRPNKDLLSKIERYIDKLKLRKALRECDLALGRFPDSADLYNLRGLTYDLWDDVDEAKKNYEKALTLDPEHKEAKENLDALHKEGGQKEPEVQTHIEHFEPVENFSSSQEIKETAFYSPELAQKHYRKGLQFDEKDDIENALEHYRKALQFNPGLNEAFENLSILEEALADEFFETNFFEQLDLALDFFYESQKERALSVCYALKDTLRPISAAHNELGMIFEEMEELEEAQSLYQKAAQLNPRLIAAFTNWQNINDKIEAMMYELPPIEDNDLIDFDDHGNWQGLIEPLPGWVYNNANVYFLRGTPGHRTLPWKSGYDPIDNAAEEGRIEGIIIRSLLMFQLRTHNPIYLISMASVGFFMALPLILGTIAFLQGNLVFLAVMLPSVFYWGTGLLLLINVFLSLITKRPDETEDDGNPFF